MSCAGSIVLYTGTYVQVYTILDLGLSNAHLEVDRPRFCYKNAPGSRNKPEGAERRAGGRVFFFP